MPPEIQVIQPTNFFWTSLTKYSYSVPNPLFETDSSLFPIQPFDLLTSPTFVFEVVRSTGVQCRLLLATASRLINNVPARRSRIHPSVSRITPEQNIIATSLGVAVRRFLETVPEIPLPRLFKGDDLPMFESDDMSIKSLSVPGLTTIQTAR